jgi:hypothetical protein
MHPDGCAQSLVGRFLFLVNGQWLIANIDYSPYGNHAHAGYHDSLLKDLSLVENGRVFIIDDLIIVNLLDQLAPTPRYSSLINFFTIHDSLLPSILTAG